MTGFAPQLAITVTARSMRRRAAQDNVVGGRGAPPDLRPSRPELQFCSAAGITSAVALDAVEADLVA